MKRDSLEYEIRRREVVLERLHTELKDLDRMTVLRSLDPVVTIQAELSRTERLS